MTILGISAYYHDSAAAIIVDGGILAAAQEERFTRIKHDHSFPSRAITYCLEEAGVTMDEVDIVAFYDKPFLKFERLLETYYAFSPRGVRSFVRSIPIWVKEKLFLKSTIKKELKAIGPLRTETVLLFPEHHLSHAASAYYPSPFQEAAILTLDGVGEWATSSICHGRGKDVKILKELRFPHSVGLLYSSFTYFLGFKVNSGEYKMMGLAPYGNPDSELYRQYTKIIKDTLVDIRPDGSIGLHQQYFTYPTGSRMVDDAKWAQLFDMPRRTEASPIEQHHMDLALAIQHVTEDIVIAMCKTAQQLTGSKNLCLAGGVALNCVANGKIIESGIFDQVWIQPAAGDAGGAPGAAYAAYHIYAGHEMPEKHGKDTVRGSYLGPAYHEGEIEKMAKAYKAHYTLATEDTLYTSVADIIADGNVVGWFQGRMEFGPRALGHRSIIADARNSEMQRKLNLKIKYRESFRPFAPSVLEEDKERFFDIHCASPYMLLVKAVADHIQIPPPTDYHQLPIKEKLAYQRSSLPSITHVDYSARIQTVDGEHNPEYHSLLQAFKQKTGDGILINTSFNVRGEPIVCTPEDAYRCFMRTEMDYLVIGKYIFEKSQQPAWKKVDNWQEEFELD